MARVCLLTARQAEALELHAAQPHCGAHKHVSPEAAEKLVKRGVARVVAEGKAITAARCTWATVGKPKRTRDGTFTGPPGMPGHQMI